MINARKNVLTSLLLLSLSGAVFAANSMSGMSQQELNKLGQDAAKGTKAIQGFKIDDSQLKTIKADYANSDLVTTYNPNKAATEQGSAKKWQCLSYTDAQIQAMYKSSNPSEKSLAAECDPIRLNEMTNDKMQGRYGDPLENELVRLFTERQNSNNQNASAGNVNISCSPLAGSNNEKTEESCIINMLPVEKTCVRTLKVACYASDTGKYHNDLSNQCMTKGGIDPNKKMGSSVTFDQAKKTVTLSGNGNPISFWVEKKEEALTEGDFILEYVTGWKDGKLTYLNGTEIYKGKSGSSPNSNINHIIVDGWNTLSWGGGATARIRGPYYTKKENCEIICTETWEEACVDRGFLNPNDANDIDLTDK